MYVTRPLSWLRRSPENLSQPPPEGPNSGLLVLSDDESELTCCFGLCKRKSITNLPIPQNKDIRIWYSLVDVVCLEHVLFVPVLDQPLSSNRYYVIRRKGKHEGQAYANSKEEDKSTVCCCSCTRDVDPRPFNPSDTYHQFEIFRRRFIESFYAKSVPLDGTPPEFLRRKDWAPRMHKPRHYHLSEALGVNTSLRANLPEFNFSLFSASSKPVVVGKWYCPFMFVKEEMSLKEQMRLSTFYEMTLEQRWEKIFGIDNVEGNVGARVVCVDVVVQREEAFVEGTRAVWDKRSVEDGVIWFRGKGVSRVGLRVEIVERMKWEEERVGWLDGNEREGRVERRDEFKGKGGWIKFGCYVLVERFLLKRMDGTIALAYDFRHIHQIRSKWE